MTFLSFLGNDICFCNLYCDKLKLKVIDLGVYYRLFVVYYCIDIVKFRVIVLSLVMLCFLQLLSIINKRINFDLIIIKCK